MSSDTVYAHAPMEHEHKRLHAAAIKTTRCLYLHESAHPDSPVLLAASAFFGISLTARYPSTRARLRGRACTAARRRTDTGRPYQAPPNVS